MFEFNLDFFTYSLYISCSADFYSVSICLVIICLILNRIVINFFTIPSMLYFLANTQSHSLSYTTCLINKFFKWLSVNYHLTVLTAFFRSVVNDYLLPISLMTARILLGKSVLRHPAVIGRIPCHLVCVSHEWWRGCNYRWMVRLSRCIAWRR